jgi:hypothetical protein
MGVGRPRADPWILAGAFSQPRGDRQRIGAPPRLEEAVDLFEGEIDLIVSARLPAPKM